MLVLWLLLMVTTQSSFGIATFEYHKCCPENQVFDLDTKKCRLSETEFASIPVDPHIIDAQENFRLTLETNAASFGIPKCLENEVLTVLRPYDGHNTEYKVIFANNDTELGLFQPCGGNRFPKGQQKYCFDRGFKENEHDSTISLVCNPKTQSGGCLHVCCPEGQFYKFVDDKTTCTNLSVNLNWDNEFNKLGKKPTYNSNPCKNGEGNTEIVNHANEDFMSFLSPQEYCLTFKEDNDGEIHKAIYKCISAQGQFPFEVWQETVDFTLVPILMGISIVFLIILQWTIWSEKKQKLYECMMLCNIWMLTLVYIILIILKTKPPQMGGFCEFLGIMFHYAYMSAFAWLSAMSYFIWKAFSGLSSRSKNLRKRKYGFLHPTFKFYALFAFGCPAIVSIVTIIMQYGISDENKENFIVPRLGVETCTLGTSGEGYDIPQLWYFHLFNIIVLFSTACFFCLFIWKMTAGFWAVDQSLAATEKEKAERRKQRLIVVMKMFLVMGITWIAEIVSWAISAKHTSHAIYANKGLRYSDLIFTIINSSQGLLMFLAVFFDRNRIKAIQGKYSEFTGAGTSNSNVDDTKIGTAMTSVANSRKASAVSNEYKMT